MSIINEKNLLTRKIITEYMLLKSKIQYWVEGYQWIQEWAEAKVNTSHEWAETKHE